MADVRSIIHGSGVANTPSLASNTTVAAANLDRGAWTIQNQSTNTLYVLLGAGATTSVFHFSLKAAGVANDGSGGSVGQSAGTVYTGVITIAGTSPNYTYLEL